MTGCVGHLLRSARGFRAFDANDKEIGVFETARLGLVALLERATDRRALKENRGKYRPNAPFAEPVRLSKTSVADEIRRIGRVRLR